MNCSHKFYKALLLTLNNFSLYWQLYLCASLKYNLKLPQVLSSLGLCCYYQMTSLNNAVLDRRVIIIVSVISCSSSLENYMTCYSYLMIVDKLLSGTYEFIVILFFSSIYTSCISPFVWYRFPITSIAGVLLDPLSWFLSDSSNCASIVCCIFFFNAQ